MSQGHSHSPLALSTPEPGQPNGNESGDVNPPRAEPRGRKANNNLPPSRAREVQRAFRQRRAEHLAALEERVIDLEAENNFLRARLGIPEGPVANLGTGPTGRGKALKEGGVPMSERVRARKEAREKERLRLLAMGIVMEPPPTRGKGKKADATPSESGNDSDRVRETSTVSPARATASLAGLSGLYDAPFPAFTGSSSSNNQFGLPFPPFNWNDNPPPTPAPLPPTPRPGSNPDAIAQLQQFLTSGNDLSWAFPGGLASFGAGQHDATPPTPNTAPTPSSSSSSDWTGMLANWKPPPSPAAPPIPRPPAAQPDLLHRLKMCCRFSDNHVERDPGLLVFAIHLCSNVSCSFGGQHDGKRPRDIEQEDDPAISLELAWPALQHQLDPNAAIDGEKRLNTAKMAAELLLRANALRTQAKPDAPPAVGCRRREGMSVSADLIRRLVEGLGGKAEDVRFEER